MINLKENDIPTHKSFLFVIYMIDKTIPSIFNNEYCYIHYLVDHVISTLLNNLQVILLM